MASGSRFVRYATLAIAASSAVGFALAFVPHRALSASPVSFAIRTARNEAPFIVQVTDPATIALGRSLVGTSTVHALSGLVIVGALSDNPGWSFHLDPSTVRLPTTVPQSCSTSATSVQAHLDHLAAFLPGRRWCPANVLFLEETRPVTPAPRPIGTVNGP